MPNITPKDRTSGKTSTRFTIGHYDHSGFRPICHNLSSDQIKSLVPAIPGATSRFSHWEELS